MPGRSENPCASIAAVPSLRTRSAYCNGPARHAYYGGNFGREVHMEKALFGAGCFWGVEDFFRQVPGVSDAVSGYAGGTTENPTYKQVCHDETYHAEVVEVTFDPSKVSYRTLVELFFRMHNPTQKNRQGPDVGTQYRSVIFTQDAEQARIAAEEKAK